MASQWHSLVSQKLFLARTLLRQADSDTNAEVDSYRALQREAAIQGAIELSLRARTLLLVMIARLYQQKNEEPESLTALSALLGTELPEVAELLTLAHQPGSWWNLLDQLETSQSTPPAARKTVSAENIIAISAESGPDRSTPALNTLLDALKQFADTLEDRHSEW
ncbi:DUF6586 family protein [uncultured Marinobacter sp.]|uniref:DUF6586 family protein n=1 Tax=uncultured Marinobacter sp. TaxID=187379 RepID=UPI002636AE76|nr:DUF6586 family protein [uncultured Marinobacter sp.]